MSDPNKRIKELLEDYKNGIKGSYEELEYLKSLISRKGHSFENLIANKLRGLEYQIIQSTIYRLDEDVGEKERTTRYNEFDMEITKSIKTERFRFLGFLAWDIKYLAEVKSNKDDSEIIFRQNKSRRFPENYHPYFPFLMFPFTSYATIKYYQLDRLEPKLFGIKDLFDQYNNVAVSLQYYPQKEVKDKFGMNYSSGGDLIKLSNDQKDAFEEVFKSFHDEYLGTSLPNIIHYVVTDFSEKLEGKSYYSSFEVGPDSFSKSLDYFYSKFVDHYKIKEQELTFNHEIFTEDYSLKRLVVKQDFAWKIAERLTKQLSRHKNPFVLLPILIYQGNSFLFDMDQESFFIENPVVYSYNFRKKRMIKFNEYPVLLFNNQNLNQIENITSFLKRKILNYNRRNLIIFYFDILYEIFLELSNLVNELFRL